MTTYELTSFLNDNLVPDITQVIFGMVKEMEQKETEQKETRDKFNNVLQELRRENRSAVYEWHNIMKYCFQEDPIYWRGDTQPDFFVSTERDDINPLYECLIISYYI